MTKRIIHCGTGTAGAQALRAIIRHPDLELAGLLVSKEGGKAGKDAGELCGEPETGVVATDNFDAVLDIEADAVCYMLLLPDLDQICALLASGKNVLTTAGMMFPAANRPDAQARIDAACREGRSSFYVSGINPGFVDEILPLVMSSLCRDIDTIHIREYADCAQYPAPHIIGIMGFGKTLADVESGAVLDMAVMREFFTQSVAALANALHCPLDEIRESREFALTDKAYDIRAGHIPAGTIAGQRWRWVGLREGRERIVQETYWITAFDLGEGWPQRGAMDNDTQWQVTLEGSPSLRVTFEPRYSFADKALPENPDFNPSGLATAMAVVNAIERVCVAPAGLVNSHQLPLPHAVAAMR